MLILGIDPGLTGAVSLIGDGLLECADLPIASNGMPGGRVSNWLDAQALDALLASWSARHDFAGRTVAVAIERPIPMPSMPSTTIASTFDTFGALRGLISAKSWGRNLSFPNPNTWKRVFGLKGGHDAKNESRTCALRLYPSAPVTRAKDHNRAESVLIARWCQMELA
jgi:crossover junction endodeoxyribonuclease RuvC